MVQNGAPPPLKAALFGRTPRTRLRPALKVTNINISVCTAYDMLPFVADLKTKS